MASLLLSRSKMEMEIVKQEKNLFLEREEFVLNISNETSPTFDEVKTELGKDAELTVVKKIHTGFGKQKFVADVFVYNNAEVKAKVETVPQKVRKKMEAEKKAAEEAAKKAEEAKIVEEAKAKEEAAATETKEVKEEVPVETESLKDDSGESEIKVEEESDGD
jgi:ribosomal protein S24E